MNISQTMKLFGRFVEHNSQTLLTAAAVGGVITTAATAHKAALDARDKIFHENQTQYELVGMTRKEEVALVWKCYIPPVLTCGATIACIIGAHSTGQRRQAAMGAAYSLTERAFSEYREKVVEQIGAKKEEGVRVAVAEDRTKTDEFKNTEILLTGDGDVDFYESFTARRFKSKMEVVRKAENDINFQIINDMCASLNDFHRLLGLPYSGAGEDLGWYNGRPLELQFSTVLVEDKPCVSIGYRHLPVPEYYKHG